MTIDAPAKVNLTLRVLGRRDDGFHEIETLMAPITLADRLVIDLRADHSIHLTCSDPSVPSDASNLAYRAADAFIKHTGLKFGVDIHIEKNIPHGAGLGGGSSDAAAVLVALNRMLETNMPAEELERLAATMGSDIPFFIRSQPAICRGRGEVIEPFEGLPNADILLVKPPFPIPTPWAYQAWAKSPKHSATFQQFHGSIPLMNDLEAPVFSKYLLLPVLKAALSEQPSVSAAMMSGSGSTIFAILRDSAEGIEEWVHKEFGESFQTFRAQLITTKGGAHFLMPPDDAELMQRTAAGDERAFEELVERYQMLVIGTIAKMLGDASTAEDLAQQVFIRVWQAASRYTATAKFTTWLMTITRNLVFNETRRRGRARLFPMEHEDGTPREIHDVASVEPGHQLQEKELQDAIETAIASLPEQQRLALILRRYEEMAYEDIAAVLETTVPSVKSLLFRAREELRSKLARFLDDSF